MLKIPHRILSYLSATRPKLILLGLSLSVWIPPEAACLAEEEPDATVFSETIHSGLLFIDGKHLPSPYEITVTKDSLQVNELNLESSQFLSGDYSAGDESQGRMRGESGRGRNPKAVRRSSQHRAARTLADWLLDDCVVVAFADSKATIVVGGAAEFDFYDALLAKDPLPGQIEKFVGLVHDPKLKAVWRQWLTDAELPQILRERMTVSRNSIEDTEMEGLRKAAAVMRLDNFAYPLTLVAMFLGVVAFGHLLKWTGRSMLLDQNHESAPESVRYAELALLLMLGMSTVDLVWTILAGQAGVINEVNPLAARLMTSPLSLAFFKVFATAVGCGILYGFRKRQRVRDATWWTCLVCVLVTFRWVMFDSMT